MITRSDLGWYQWHAPYDELVSGQTQRLAVVQEVLTEVFDTAPPGPLHAMSMCCGQARDLLPILISHPRGRDTDATLVELDPLNASFLHGALGSTDLHSIHVMVADAGLTDTYAGLTPADVVLMGGVFANISLADASRTVDHLAMLCSPDAYVVWSTYGPALDDAEEVVALFETDGFARVSIHREDGPDGFVVGCHRRIAQPHTLVPGERIFTFVAPDPSG